MINLNIVRIFKIHIRILNRICTRMSHMRYAVINHTHIEIHILKP
jgi:hypothetical protein